jgi:AIPR protein
MPQIKFKCYSLRAIPNPNTIEINSDFKYYTLLVSIFDLPIELSEWREINPRDPNVDTPVAKAIKNTLTSAPDTFFLRNRGLTILVESLLFDNSDNTVTLEMSKKESHGLLDGGHTYQVIQNYLGSKENLQNSYVKLEIFTSVEDVDEVVQIVGGRNKSTQVDPSSLQNLDGSFDNIKETLKNQPYFNKIAFKDNEIDEDGIEKPIEILDILSYFCCFDIFSYKDEKKNPTVAYSSKGTIAQKYSSKTYKANIEKITHLLPDILLLRDKIITAIPIHWKSENGIKTYGQLRDVGKVEEILPFSGEKNEYSVAGAYYYPILAAFRAVINKDYEWKYPIFEIFNEIIVNVIKDVKDKRSNIDNLNQLGKDNTLWTACYKTVENYLQSKEIEDLKKQLNIKLND